MKGLVTWILILACVSQLCLAKNIGTEITSYNVMHYGAIGDGIFDDSQAFSTAWENACGAEGTGTLVIPPNKAFSVQNTNFSGPCKAKTINFQLQGKLVAPPKVAWTGDKFSLILFSKVIHFHSCNDLHVNYLHIINSPRAHIVIENTVGAFFSHINIQAPSNSPNTDGFDISISKNIMIRDSTIGTGDDCVAIIRGSSYINVTGVACGPGHGISVGSLGKDNSYDTVEEVHVQNCSFSGTTNGARIKIWQGGSGFARKITFDHIRLDRVLNPIIIDEGYVDRTQMNAKFRVSDVQYRGFQGTSANDRVIDLDCSLSDCFNITLDHVNIVYPVPGKQAYAFCKNAHGIATVTVPNVTCLLK
ncbi:hypothetical protein VNO77_09274 [Canavalia gladiata]|uniref:Polygalacturonase n=1 Tax=Canavalia gladiata TaxID=3824 RepID=A0AAN9QU50_CANGL